MIRVLYFGTPSLSVPPLEALVAMPNIDVIGVVTPPPKPVGRKQIMTMCPVESAARALYIPVHHASKKSEVLALIESLQPDISIVIAFGVIFPESALQVPKHGTVNVHFSLLPAYRGASPVQSAVLDGHRTSGITLQRMVYELDAGDILLQESTDITDLTTGEIWDKMSLQTAALLPGFIHAYTAGDIIPVPQDNTKATHCTKFRKEDACIIPKVMSAEEVYQRILAFNPWPVAYINTPFGALKLHTAMPPNNHKEHNKCLLRCANETTVPIVTAQIPGGKPLLVQDLLRGHPQLHIYFVGN